MQRGAASHWPAVRDWTLQRLAELDPERDVQVVVGDREQGATRFERAKLGAYLRSVAVDDATSRGRYLKEFDLLGEFPRLRRDLLTAELFPSGNIVSGSAWIGPTAHTGLHHDLLDNAAVQVVGHKRFLLCRPGTVERAGALSRRYDQWARLSSLNAAEIARIVPGSDDFFVVDLAPGDVLRVPGGWWHEVLNLSPAVLLSGFGGPRSHVASLWGKESARHLMHRLKLAGRHGCTCHSNESRERSDEMAPVVRFLTVGDVPELIRLEQQKWTEDQAASDVEMRLRISTHPTLSMGAFCPRTGTALASLFLRPITEAMVVDANDWRECARITSSPARTSALFGISLSSSHSAAVNALLVHFWPHALKAGWRDIYLGSPVPGLRSWRRNNPTADVGEYVRARRHGLPADPQLRYYHGKGFRHIVAWKPDYFPHEASLNHGVVLRGSVALSGPSLLWKRVPVSWLERLRPLMLLALQAKGERSPEFAKIGTNVVRGRTHSRAGPMARAQCVAPSPVRRASTASYEAIDCLRGRPTWKSRRW